MLFRLGRLLLARAGLAAIRRLAPEVCAPAPEDWALERLALRQQLAMFKHKQTLAPKKTDRLFWVALRAQLADRWQDWLHAVQPATVVAWHRQGFRLFWRWKSRHRSRGRPPIAKELRAVIKRLALENPDWGAPRIHAEVLMLGFDVDERTVSRYLAKLRPRSPRSGEAWRRFLLAEADGIAAMDFFVVPTATFRLTYGFFIIHHGSRKVVHTNAAYFPSEHWVAQQLREAFPAGAPCPKYLLCDRDSAFSAYVESVAEAMGIRVIRTGPRAPWQNGIAERFIGSVRRELLDNFIVLGPWHLTRLLNRYERYYNDDRPHLSLNKNAPMGRKPEKKPAFGSLRAHPRLWGLHHRYSWQ